MSLTSFTRAYVDCALWSSTDTDGMPLDSVHAMGADLSPAFWTHVETDCAAFYTLCAHLWVDHYSDENAGHDFWLTRNQHGAGFWDGDLPKDVGEALTDAAHKLGEVDLYVGDDGAIFALSIPHTRNPR